MFNHLCTVKKEWKIIRELQRKSGIGLDNNLKMITFNQKTYDMDGLSFIQDMYFWKILTKGFNFSKKKKIILLENILQYIFKYVTKHYK